MTIEALRQIMTLASRRADALLFSALYDLLLATSVLLPRADGPVEPLVAGPNGELAVTIFLDDAALVRWARSPRSHRVVSAH